ncbi:MAG: phage portal protein [Hyphomicrobiales bacterium]
MGILSNIFGGKKKVEIVNKSYSNLGHAVDLLSPDWLRGEGGDFVSPEAAMQHSVVFGCVKVRSGIIGSLRINIENAATHVKNNDHDLHDLLDVKPNNLVSAREMWEQVIIDMDYVGRAYVRIIRKNLGSEVTALIRCSDHDVRVKVTKELNPKLIYLVTNPWGGTDIVDQSDMLHFRNFGSADLLGETPIQISGRSIAVGTIEEKYSKSYFETGGQIKDIVEFPHDPSSEQIKKFKDDLALDHGGADGFKKVAVITNGGTHKRLTLSAQDANTLETRKFSVEQICRLFGVPMVMIGSLDKQTSFGKGVGEQFKFFINLTLNPILQKIENEVKIKLFTDNTGFEMRFNRSGLTKSDLEASTKADSASVGGNQIPGVMTQNEIRDKNGLPRNEDPQADKLYQPVEKIDNKLKPKKDEGE